MAKTYKLVQSTAVPVDPKTIEVEVSETKSVTKKDTVSVSRLENNIATIDKQIAALQAQKAEVQAELVEVNKVITSTTTA